MLDLPYSNNEDKKQIMIMNFNNMIMLFIVDIMKLHDGIITNLVWHCKAVCCIFSFALCFEKQSLLFALENALGNKPKKSLLMTVMPGLEALKLPVFIFWQLSLDLSAKQHKTRALKHKNKRFRQQTCINWISLHIRVLYKKWQ